jgi:hypothetical protein
VTLRADYLSFSSQQQGRPEQRMSSWDRQGECAATGGEIIVGGVLIFIRASLIALTRRLVVIRPRLILITRRLVALTRRLVTVTHGESMALIVQVRDEFSAADRAARNLGRFPAGRTSHNLRHRLPFAGGVLGWIPELHRAGLSFRSAWATVSTQV